MDHCYIQHATTTQRSHIGLCSIFRTLLIALILLSRSGDADSQSCPLTDTQTRNAIDAFAPIANFLSHEPRCANCHGGVNAFIHGTGLDPNNPLAPPSQVIHGGGFISRQNDKAKDGTKLIESECQDCHNKMVPKRDGSPSIWFDAPPFLSFVSKDATTLCRQIKRATHTAETLMNHLEDDDGGNNFAKTAFKGDRGLDPDRFDEIPPAKPSLTQDQVKQLAQKWINAMGGRFQGDESCGCELRHSLWSGQIQYMIQHIQDNVSSTTGGHYSNQWSRKLIITVNNGTGTFQGHVEQHLDSLGLQPVAHQGGGDTYRRDSSDAIDETGDGSIPARVDVEIDEARGTYNIKLGASPTAGFAGGKPLVIGTGHWTRCIRDDCTSGDRNIGMPSLPSMGPLSGKLQDPNHIQASLTFSKKYVGYARDAMNIETMTVDLWRSGASKPK